MKKQKITVITGGGSRNSVSGLLAEKILKQTLAELKQRGIEAQHVTHHLGEYAYDMAEMLSDDLPSTTLAEVFEDVRSATGIITVAPVFRASYSGVFKLFWDLTEDGDVENTPVLLAATGGSARHALVLDYALRPLFSYLGADSISRGVYATPDQVSDYDRQGQRVQARLMKASAELARKVAAAAS